MTYQESAEGIDIQRRRADREVRAHGIVPTFVTADGFTFYMNDLGTAWTDGHDDMTFSGGADGPVEVCSPCDGSGRRSAHYIRTPDSPCDACNGTGHGAPLDGEHVGEWREWQWWADAQVWPVAATKVLQWLGY